MLQVPNGISVVFCMYKNRREQLLGNNMPKPSSKISNENTLGPRLAVANVELSSRLFATWSFELDHVHVQPLERKLTQADSESEIPPKPKPTQATLGAAARATAWSAASGLLLEATRCHTHTRMCVDMHGPVECRGKLYLCVYTQMAVLRLLYSCVAPSLLLSNSLTHSCLSLSLSLSTSLSAWKCCCVKSCSWLTVEKSDTPSCETILTALHRVNPATHVSRGTAERFCIGWQTDRNDSTSKEQVGAECMLQYLHAVGFCL